MLIRIPFLVMMCTKVSLILPISMPHSSPLFLSRSEFLLAEKVLLALFTIAGNQIPYLADPAAHYVQFMRQFAFLTAPTCREALVGVLDAFAKRMPELVVVVSPIFPLFPHSLPLYT
jgi:hypothetical protein